MAYRRKRRGAPKKRAYKRKTARKRSSRKPQVIKIVLENAGDGLKTFAQSQTVQNPPRRARF